MPATLDPPAAGPEATRPEGALARVWIGVLLAPASWAADFMVRYFAIRYANIHDRRWPMAASTIVALLPLIVGAALCWRERRRAKADTIETLANWGLALAVFFLLLILAQAFPTLVLRAREIT